MEKQKWPCRTSASSLGQHAARSDADAGYRACVDLGTEAGVEADGDAAACPSLPMLVPMIGTIGIADHQQGGPRTRLGGMQKSELPSGNPGDRTRVAGVYGRAISEIRRPAARGVGRLPGFGDFGYLKERPAPRRWSALAPRARPALLVGVVVAVLVLAALAAFAEARGGAHRRWGRGGFSRALFVAVSSAGRLVRGGDDDAHDRAAACSAAYGAAERARTPCRSAAPGSSADPAPPPARAAAPPLATSVRHVPRTTVRVAQRGGSAGSTAPRATMRRRRPRPTPTTPADVRTATRA